jgi:hypothetical protein
MENLNRNGMYLLIVGVIAFLIYFIFGIGNKPFSCDVWAENVKNNKEFHLILTGKYNHNQSRDSYLYGIDLKTNQKTEYYDGSGWITRNLEKFYIGDTLVKAKGKYSIIIKRKSKTITVPFECDRIYNDR